MRVDDPPLLFGETVSQTNDAPNPSFMGLYIGPSGHAFWPHLVLVIRDRNKALENWTGTVQKVNWIRWNQR